MFGKILVGITEGERGEDAMALGRALARATGASLLNAPARGGNGSGLGELTRSEEVDLLVLTPSHRGPVGRVLPGSTAERLLGRALCPVAIAPEGFGSAGSDARWRLPEDDEDSGLRVIGVGYDGTPAAADALRTATELAVSNGAALRVIAVSRSAPLAHSGAPETQTAPQQAVEELYRELNRAVAELPPEARAEGIFLRGFPVAELLGATEKGVDLLVLGSRPGGPVRRALQGSVSSAVIEAAACPVLIVPAGVRARSRVAV